MSLWLMLSAHFLADFSLQSNELAEKKTKQFRYLLRHVLIYSAMMAIAMFSSTSSKEAWIPYLIIVLSHFVVDGIRGCFDNRHNNPAKHFASFIVDQVLHIAVIIFSVYMFELNKHNTLWLTDLASRYPAEKILRYALIFIIILDPASVFVKKLSNYVSANSDNSSQKKEPPAGSVIGKLERILTAILVLCDEIGAIGFVLTAKSLARYKQLDDRGFAEKYLVGTLSSTAIAIIVALLLT